MTDEGAGASLGIPIPKHADEVVVWRAGDGMRVGAWVLLIGLAIGALAVVTSMSEWIALVPVGAFAVLGWKVWVSILRPRTVVDRSGVTIRAGRTRQHATWAEIVACAAGYSGLVVTCADGRELLVPYPQKANLDSWLGVRTSADAAADYLMARAEQARKSMADAAEQGPFCQSCGHPYDHPIHVKVAPTNNVDDGYVVICRAQDCDCLDTQWLGSSDHVRAAAGENEIEVLRQRFRNMHLDGDIIGG